MMETALLALALANLVFGGLLGWSAVRQSQARRAGQGLEAWGADFERRLEESVRRAAAEASRASARELERELRTVLEAGAREARTELGQSLATMQTALVSQGGDVARTQNERLDTFAARLDLQSQAGREALDAALRRFGDGLGEQVRVLAESQQRQLADVRQTVEARLVALQEGNERRLEQMRATVDEKLHATLEARLGESFRQVADRLEQVHKGLGEMQVLARDVGSLNRVLSNVKTRGTFGEVQLGGLLEQVFAPDQYAANVETVPGTGARVEYAIRLPGRRDDGQPVWLPIDAKFPREDYERLLEAQDHADPVAAEAAGRALEKRLQAEARSIRAKYVAPPHTTDLALLFVPTEGLYAEALRRPGLVDSLQREHRVSLCGPTTLHATLTSLQMGFRTLALERRSAEVWEVLAAVKTEFGRFGEALAKTKKKLEEAQNNIDTAARRTRVMNAKLRSVEALPGERAQALLGEGPPPGEGDEAEEASA